MVELVIGALAVGFILVLVGLAAYAAVSFLVIVLRLAYAILRALMAGRRGCPQPQPPRRVSRIPGPLPGSGPR